MGKIIKNGIDYSPTIHMPANTATQAGAVAAGGANYNKVWGTDSQGNPGWIEASGGGHTIKNDSGTSLAQKDNLLFKGIYTQNSGDNTEVDIVRQLTKAQIDALSGEAAKGFMEATDESSDLPLMANMVEYSTGVSTKDKIDNIDLTSGGTVNGRFTVNEKNGTTSTDGSSTLELGNNISSGTAENSRGRIWLYSNNDKSARIYAKDDMTANRNIYFPDKNGTLAVVDDVTSGSFSAGSNITIGSRNFWRKEGNFVFATVVLTVTANLSATAVLLSDNELDFVNNSYLYARNEDGSIRILTCAGHNIYTEFDIPNGTVLRIGQVIFTQ